MKKFLVLQLRPVDAASDQEFKAFLRYGNLAENEVLRIRMEQNGIPHVDLSHFSGVIVGGGPSNVSDRIEKKSSAQRRFERQLTPLLKEVVTKDFPFLGACYGLGALTHSLAGMTSKEKYSEDVSAVDVTLTTEGEKDPLLQGLPKTFKAIVGHKEACQQLPKGATWLAKGDTCPFQMYRVQKNVYATQFHPELDQEGVNVRVDIYKHDGYFPPEEAEEVKKRFEHVDISVPQLILARWVERYSK